jgi:hypothetical protein
MCCLEWLVYGWNESMRYTASRSQYYISSATFENNISCMRAHSVQRELAIYLYLVHARSHWLFPSTIVDEMRLVMDVIAFNLPAVGLLYPHTGMSTMSTA